jgi:invasion protein IalB
MFNCAEEATMLRLVVPILLVLPMSLTAVAPVRAQQPTRTSATYDGWTVNCVQQKDKRMACQVTQIQQPQGQSAPASEVTITELPGGKAARIALQVPPNVSIAQGVRLVLQGKPGKDKKPDRIGTPIAAPLRVCIASRCLAQADVPEATLRTALRADSGLIVFNEADQREVSIQFSFQGLEAAWKESQKGVGGSPAAARR